MYHLGMVLRYCSRPPGLLRRRLCFAAARRHAPRGHSHDDRPGRRHDSVWADSSASSPAPALRRPQPCPAGGDPHSFEPSLQDRNGSAAPRWSSRTAAASERRYRQPRRRRRRRHAGVRGRRPRRRASTITATVTVTITTTAITTTRNAITRRRRSPHLARPDARRRPVPPLADALVAAGADLPADRRSAPKAPTQRLAPARPRHQQAPRHPPGRTTPPRHEPRRPRLLRRPLRLRVLGSVLPSTSTLTAARRRSSTARRRHRAAGVPAIFAELRATTDRRRPGRPPRRRVVMLYSDAVGPPGSGAETYQGMMRNDAAPSPRPWAGGRHGKHKMMNDFLTDPWAWWVEPFLSSDSVRAATPGGAPHRRVHRLSSAPGWCCVGA